MPKHLLFMLLALVLGSSTAQALSVSAYDNLKNDFTKSRDSLKFFREKCTSAQGFESDPKCSEIWQNRKTYSSEYLVNKMLFYKYFSVDILAKLVEGGYLDQYEENSRNILDEYQDDFRRSMFILTAAPLEDLVEQEVRVNAELNQMHTFLNLASTDNQLNKSVAILERIQREQNRIEQHIGLARKAGHKTAVAENRLKKAKDLTAKSAEAHMEARQEILDASASQGSEFDVTAGVSSLLRAHAYSKEALSEMEAAVQILKRLNESGTWSSE